MQEREKERERENALSERVIGASMAVHRALGPGLLESAYETCLAYEFQDLGLPFERQVTLPILYKGRLVDGAFRIDFIVDGCLVVELKAVEKLLPVHEAQLLTYLRFTNLSVGLLLNFQVPLLRDGIRRLVR